MSTARHILFPVDFSERCKAVRPSVIAMARHFGARLTLMHVLPIPVGWYGGMGEAHPVMFDVSAVTENAHRQLDAFFGTPEASLEIDTIVESGEPAACITDYAERNDVGMIMIPTHGYGRFRSLLLGAVTAKVLHDAKCVVWTSAHTEDPLLAGRAEYKTILCAIGLKPKNSGLICYAASLARSFNAQLRLVHAVSFAETRPQEFGETDFSRSLVQMSREEIAIRQQEAGTDVPLCLELGSVPSVVRRAALEHGADLLVIGRGRLHETFGRLRTNEYAIIRDSPCPVVSA